MCVKRSANPHMLLWQVATGERLLDEQATSAEMAQKAILQDALITAEEEKIRLVSLSASANCQSPSC